MKYLSVAAIIILLNVACRNSMREISMEELNRDVENSRALLKQVEKYNDSLNVALSLLDAQIEELLLLSKDVENPGACAVLGNRYFENLFEDLSLDQGKRAVLTPRLGKEEMELVIKKNELFVLNELVFQNSGSDVRLFAAPEKTGE